MRNGKFIISVAVLLYAVQVSSVKPFNPLALYPCSATWQYEDDQKNEKCLVSLELSQDLTLIASISVVLNGVEYRFPKKCYDEIFQTPYEGLYLEPSCLEVRPGEYLKIRLKAVEQVRRNSRKLTIEYTFNLTPPHKVIRIIEYRKEGTSPTYERTEYDT